MEERSAGSAMDTAERLFFSLWQAWLAVDMSQFPTVIHQPLGKLAEIDAAFRAN
jgi:hypothetical protein